MYEGKHPVVVFVDCDNNVMDRIDYRCLQYFQYKARLDLPASMAVKGKSLAMLKATEELPLWSLKDASVAIEQFVGYAKTNSKRYFRFIVDDYTKDALQRHYRVYIELTEKGILVTKN